MLDRYLDIIGQHARLFPHLGELLDNLTIPWGVVTNKPLRYAQPLLEALKLYDSCGALVCPDHVSKTKPDPEPLLLACTQLRCSAANSVYIGDHQRDIEAGRAAGMHTIAAAYGYLTQHDDTQQWAADAIANQAKELRNIIATMSRQE